MRELLHYFACSPHNNTNSTSSLLHKISILPKTRRDVWEREEDNREEARERGRGRGECKSKTSCD